MPSYDALIPNSLYSEKIPTDGKYSFLYIGRQSLEFLHDSWLSDAEDYATRGMRAEAIEERMALVAEAQSCRTRAKVLEGLMVDAENKPSIFRKLPTEPGSRITCSLPEANGVYADCVLMRATRDEDGALLYELRVIDKRPRFKNFLQRTLKFRPHLPLVIPTDDWHYLKHHENFLRLYLSI